MLIALAISLPVSAHARERSFDIARQPAAEAVKAFARQADVQILVAEPAVNGRTTNAVRGTLEVRRALDLLLAGTGIVVKSFGGGFAVLLADDGLLPESKGGEIIVTGSRLAQEELYSAMPVRVIDMEQAARLGQTSVYDALVQDSAVAAGMGLDNAFGESWDAGMSSISLRNLGTNRSLTLIDGMRRVSGSARTSAVDINMIPPAMVDHVEVITGGAAAIYGADAVTGAVNIITKRQVKGLNLSATYGLSQRGDASELAASLSTGGTFAAGRGSFSLGGTYSRYAPLGYSQRYSTYLRSIANPDNGGADDGIPDQIAVHDFRQIYYAYQPSFYYKGQSYILENGAVRAASYDRMLYSGEFSYGDGGDGRNLRDHDQLRGGIGVLAIMGRVDYAATNTLDYNGYFNFGLSNYRGTASVPLPRDDSRSMWYNGAGGGVAYLDNPYLPTALRQFMVDNDLTQLNIDRTYGNFPVMRELHDRHSLTIGQSLGGPLSGGLTWRAFHQYGRTSDHVRTTNIPYATRWPLARDVIADLVTGAAVCRDEAARAAGCIPLNIFSEDVPSQALLDYVLGTRKERRVNTQQIFGGNIIGTLFRLPAGHVSGVVGIEYRRETLMTRDDPLAATEFAYSGSGYTIHPNLDAAFDVSEVYGELSVPLLSDRPLARRLEIEGAYRYSYYNTVGGTDAWKIGGRWSPIPALMLRATRSRSVRTPNFGELYEATVSKQLGSITDPCEAGDYYQSATRSTNCRALGIAVPLGDFKVGPIITTGGNSHLLPETSNSLTLGIVLQPPFAPHLVATADYWDISITDVITQFAYTTVLNLCVDLPTIKNIFCSAVERDPSDGHVTAIHTDQVNAPKMRARGIDLGLRWNRRLGRGNLNLSLNGTYLLQQRVESAPGLSAGDVRYDGDWQNPRFQAVARADYGRGIVNATLNFRFVSAGRYDVNAQSDEVYDNNRLPSTIYVDSALALDVKKSSKIIFGTKNIFNTMPPYIYPVYKDSVLYSNIGRYFFVKISNSF